jgi:hypothetical protein
MPEQYDALLIRVVGNLMSVGVVKYKNLALFPGAIFILYL